LKKTDIKAKNQTMHIKAEREILQNVNSPFIVQLHFAFQTADKLYLVMDFMAGGELFFHLRKSRYFSESKAKFYIGEIVLALEHLHSKDIIYRDLKPENILLDFEGHIKIADFGLSKVGVSEQSKTFTFCGTPEYLAPEIIKCLGHDQAVDWWTLGTLLYEILAGEPPFYVKDRSNRNELFRMILEKPVEIKSSFSPEAASLVQAFLTVDPKQRLSDPNQIKKHSFFKGIDWKRLAAREIKPPFMPKIKGNKDLRHFDKQFTDLTIGETPSQRNLLPSPPGTGTFAEFTYAGRMLNEQGEDLLELNPDYEDSMNVQIMN